MRRILRRDDGRVRLADQSILITGAARGIGAATARRLLDAGAKVALVDADEQGLSRTVDALGGDARAFVADVAHADSIEEAVRNAASQLGGLDAIVANAGIAGPVATVGAVSCADFRSVIDVNLIGVFHTVHAALPYLIERRGYLLSVSSLMTLVPAPTAAAYGASKAGVDAMARAMRIELAEKGVGIGVAHFGLIDTPMVGGITSSTGFGEILEGLPRFFGRPVPAETAADAMVDAIARRASSACAPNYMRGLLALREPSRWVDPLMARHRGLSRVVRDAEGSRAVESEVIA